VEVNGLTVIQNGQRYPINRIVSNVIKRAVVRENPIARNGKDIVSRRERRRDGAKEEAGRKESALMEENSPAQPSYSCRLWQPANIRYTNKRYALRRAG
jgi:hypothetical protein